MRSIEKIHTIVLEGILKEYIQKELQNFSLKVILLHKNLKNNLQYFSKRKDILAVIVSCSTYDNYIKDKPLMNDFCFSIIVLSNSMFKTPQNFNIYPTRKNQLVSRISSIIKKSEEKVDFFEDDSFGFSDFIVPNKGEKNYQTKNNLPNKEVEKKFDIMSVFNDVEIKNDNYSNTKVDLGSSERNKKKSPFETYKTFVELSEDNSNPFTEIEKNPFNPFPQKRESPTKTKTSMKYPIGSFWNAGLINEAQKKKNQKKKPPKKIKHWRKSISLVEFFSEKQKKKVEKINLLDSKENNRWSISLMQFFSNGTKQKKSKNSFSNYF